MKEANRTLTTQAVAIDKHSGNGNLDLYLKVSRRQGQSFLKYYSGHNTSGTKRSDYNLKARAANLHVAEYLRRLRSNYSSNVVMSNMHDRTNCNNCRSNNTEMATMITCDNDLTTRFLRAILPPLAGSTMAKANSLFTTLN